LISFWILLLLNAASCKKYKIESEQIFSAHGATVAETPVITLFGLPVLMKQAASKRAECDNQASVQFQNILLDSAVTSDWKI